MTSAGVKALGIVYLYVSQKLRHDEGMNVTLFALLLTASSATPDACNIYAARDYRSIKLEEHEKTITVVFDQFNETFQKVTTKPFGALQEGAVAEDGKTVHAFSRTKVDGKDAIIFSSMVFFPDCPK